MPGPRVAASRFRAVEGGVVLIMVIWAVNFIAIKSAIATVPPVGFAFLRFSLAAVVMLGLLRWREGSIGLPRHLVVPVALVGALGFGVYQTLWALGLATTSAGTSSLLVQLAASDVPWVAPAAVGSILFSGILAAAIANVLVFRAMAVVGPSPVANLQFLVPALTVILAAIFLGERIAPIQLVGGAVIVAGIMLARRAPVGPPPGGRRVPQPPPLMET